MDTRWRPSSAMRGPFCARRDRGGDAGLGVTGGGDGRAPPPPRAARDPPPGARGRDHPSPRASGRIAAGSGRRARGSIAVGRAALGPVAERGDHRAVPVQRGADPGARLDIGGHEFAGLLQAAGVPEEITCYTRRISSCPPRAQANQPRPSGRFPGGIIGIGIDKQGEAQPILAYRPPRRFPRVQAGAAPAPFRAGAHEAARRRCAPVPGCNGGSRAQRCRASPQRSPGGAAPPADARPGRPGSPPLRRRPPFPGDRRDPRQVSLAAVPAWAARRLPRRPCHRGGADRRRRRDRNHPLRMGPPLPNARRSPTARGAGRCGRSLGRAGALPHAAAAVPGASRRCRYPTSWRPPAIAARSSFSRRARPGRAARPSPRDPARSPPARRRWRRAGDAPRPPAAGRHDDAGVARQGTVQAVGHQHHREAEPPRLGEQRGHLPIARPRRARAARPGPPAQHLVGQPRSRSLEGLRGTARPAEQHRDVMRHAAEGPRPNARIPGPGAAPPPRRAARRAPRARERLHRLALRPMARSMARRIARRLPPA